MLRKLSDTIKGLEIFIGGVAVGYAIKEIIQSDSFQTLKTEIINTVDNQEDEMKDVKITTPKSNDTNEIQLQTINKDNTDDKVVNIKKQPDNTKNKKDVEIKTSMKTSKN